MYEKGGVLLGDLAFEGSSPLLSIGTYLKTQGKKVKLLDFHIEDMYMRYYKQKVLEKENILESLKKYKAKKVVIKYKKPIYSSYDGEMMESNKFEFEILDKRVNIYNDRDFIRRFLEFKEKEQ